MKIKFSRFVVDEVSHDNARIKINEQKNFFIPAIYQLEDSVVKLDKNDEILFYIDKDFVILIINEPINDYQAIKVLFNRTENILIVEDISGIKMEDMKDVE